MLSAIITALVVVGLISTFVFIVNRMLRTDEHWSESNMTVSAAKPAEAQSFGRAAKQAHA